MGRPNSIADTVTRRMRREPQGTSTNHVIAQMIYFFVIFAVTHSCPTMSWSNIDNATTTKSHTNVNFVVNVSFLRKDYWGIKNVTMITIKGKNSCANNVEKHLVEVST